MIIQFRVSLFRAHIVLSGVLRFRGTHLRAARGSGSRPGVLPGSHKVFGTGDIEGSWLRFEYLIVNHRFSKPSQKSVLR